MVMTLAYHTRPHFRHCGQRAIESSIYCWSLYSNGRIYVDPIFNIVANITRTRTRNLDVFNFKRIQYHTGVNIPKPTWSIADLEMARTHSPITQHELERLARLLLVDKSAQIDDRYVESIYNLKQDLGDMIHMIQHITQKNIFKDRSDNLKENNFDEEDNPTGNDRIYDIVRGVRGIPLREVSLKESLQGEDNVEAQAVWNEKVQTKMIRRGGGHIYFAIETTDVRDQ